MEAPRLNNLI